MLHWIFNLNYLINKSRLRGCQEKKNVSQWLQFATAWLPVQVYPYWCTPTKAVDAFAQRSLCHLVHLKSFGIKKAALVWDLIKWKFVQITCKILHENKILANNFRHRISMFVFIDFSVKSSYQILQQLSWCPGLALSTRTKLSTNRFVDQF